MVKTYDICFIPTREPINGDNAFPTTQKAIKFYNEGKFGAFYVSGFCNGFHIGKGIVPYHEAASTVRFLREHNIPKKNIFVEGLAVDTSGNFVFSYLDHDLVKESPLKGFVEDSYTRIKDPRLERFMDNYCSPERNPSLKDFDSILVPGEGPHLRRMSELVNLVFPDNFNSHLEFLPVGNVSNFEPVTTVWHRGLMRQLKKTEGDLGKVIKFMAEKHPFYSPGWYDKSVTRRQGEVVKTIVEWNFN